MVIVEALGGLGLFLLGMTVMTDGLRSLAGDTVRSVLVRFTHSPLSGAITGAASTAVLQSSSATTVAAVGFVGAGLLSFPQALGIIFGANIGTTITGWIVALVGFKLKLGILALPLILLGALLRLFSRGRWASIGFAIAGFGLIFIGIDFMQQGMGGLQSVITPDDFPSDTWFGRLQLLAIGVAITVVTQSSSAGVATAMTALLAGAINFEQAAAMVIGMNVGTTVTAAVASIGGSVGSRRTGLSHVTYNLFTAAGALLLLTPYTYLLQALTPDLLLNDPELALVGFHTGFNALGVIAVLPFSQQFARLMQRLVPDRPQAYTGSLDKALLVEPNVALTTVQSTLNAELLAMLAHVDAMLGDTQRGKRVDLVELQIALVVTGTYLDQIHLDTSKGQTWQQLIAAIHSLDHMQRLYDRCTEQDRANTLRRSTILARERNRLNEVIDLITDAIKSDHWQEAARLGSECAASIAEHAEALRKDLMANIATGESDLPVAMDELDAIRWLERISTHIARITTHFADAEPVTDGQTAQHSDTLVSPNLG